MKKSIGWAFLVAFVAFAFVIALTPPIGAQSAPTTKVQGLVPAGTSPVASVNPMLLGAANGTTLKAVAADANGNLSIVGPAADDAAASGNPFVVAGKDSSGNVKVFNVTPHGSTTGATPKTAIVGGKDAGNLARALPVAATGGAIPTDVLVEGGTDGSLARAFLLDSSGRQRAIGAAANGAAIAGDPLLQAGYDGSLVRTRRLDTSGRSIAGDPTFVTYSASSAGTFASAATATDVILLKGSASKIVKVRRLVLSGIGTTAITVPVQLILRTTADTTGTFVTDTAIKHDSTAAAATAVIGHYTANPGALGTATGAWDTIQWAVQLTTVYGAPIVLDFSAARNDQAIVLNSASEWLAVNFTSTTIAGSAVSYSIEWTEE